MHEAHGEMNGCRFAGAVGPEKAEYLTRLDGEGEVVERTKTPATKTHTVILRHVLIQQHRLSHSRIGGYLLDVRSG
jgi:hypothetical protein